MEESFLLILILGLYISISNVSYYFYIIYCISGLKIFKDIIIGNSKFNIILLIKIPLTYIFSFIFIQDHNPFYHLLFFYLPFDNFFKGLFILIFITYIINNKQNYLFEKNISYLKQNKKFLYSIILILIITKISIYYFNLHLFIYFIKKEDFLKNDEKFYITANLYNNEYILPNWITQMKLLINYLGTKNVYISIFENGDSNDNTINILKEFESYLNNLKIINKIVTTPITKKGTKERIEYLTELRNLALNFIYEIPNLNFKKTKILFFNDIIFNYQDVINLLLTNKGDYDVVCGMDYYESFYDTWVSIGIDGEEFRHYFPYQLNKVAQDLYINGEIIRVFSCWNGLIIFNSKPLENKKIEFRSGIKHRESECTLFNSDLYTMGYEKKFVNTQIVFAYEYDYYYKNKYLYPWTKNLITYFYYYFYYFFEDNNYNMKDIKSKHVEFDDFLKDYYERYLIK
jgi:hypothetical protein